MFAECQQETLRGFVGSRPDGTHATGEETHEYRLVLHTFAVVERHHDTQFSIVLQQSPRGLHQFFVTQRFRVTGNVPLGVWSIQGIDEERRIAHNGIITLIIEVLHGRLQHLYAVGKG